MIVHAPAKLNLSLRVLRRREDGFHDIESLMVTLPGLHDDLEIEVSEEDSFACEAPGVPLDRSNLVLKALDLFRERTGRSQSLSIHLTKRIPHGAGLGGGSSDAALTLKTVNSLLGGGLSEEELREMGAELGSDVPFFLGTPVARVEGRGDRIVAAESLESVAVVLVKPAFGVSTPAAYQRWQESLEIPGVRYESQKLWVTELVNDLERPVFEKHRFLPEIKMWLLAQAGVEGAMMSGSGSTMFAVLRDLGVAEELINGARGELDPGMWAWSGMTAGSQRKGGKHG